MDLEKNFDEKISNEDDLPLFSESNYPRSKYVDLIDLTKGHSESQFSVLKLSRIMFIVYGNNFNVPPTATRHNWIM